MTAAPTLSLYAYAIYEDRRLDDLNRDARGLLARLTGKRRRGDVLAPHTRPGAAGYRGPNDWSASLLKPSPAGLTWHRQQTLGTWDWFVASLECHAPTDRWDSWLDGEAQRLVSDAQDAIATARLAYVDYPADADLDNVLALCRERLRGILPVDGAVALGVNRGVDQWWIVLGREDDAEVERWLLSANAGCLPRALAGRGALLALSDKLTKRAHWLEEVASMTATPSVDLSANAADLSRLSRGIGSAHEAASVLARPPGGWVEEVNALRERAAASVQWAVQAQTNLHGSPTTASRFRESRAGHSSSSRPLRILHISDLHERAAFPGMPPNREAVLRWDAEERGYILGDRFLDGLREVCGTGVDLVCFTGDLADWGHPAEYEAAAPRINQILEAVGVPRDRFFAVPGNHDVQRKVSANAWRAIRKWHADSHDGARLGRWFRGVNGAPQGLRVTPQALLERTAAFWTWFRTVRGDALGPTGATLLGYRHTLAIGALAGVDVPVHLIGLDSAWMCGDDEDQGRILVTEEQVQAHVRDGGRPLEGFRIALIHHPLDHLADHHPVRRLLGDGGVDLLLHGHQHVPVAMNVDEPGARLRVLAAGCLVEGDLGKGWPNEFHLIEVEPTRGGSNVHFRKWSKEGRFWAKGSDLYRHAPDGVLRSAVPYSPPAQLTAHLPHDLDATPRQVEAPSTPTVRATGPRRLHISWGAVSGATVYKLYRSTPSSGSYKQVYWARTPSYTDSGPHLRPSTTYCYRVTAGNSLGYSGYSGTASDTTWGDIPSVEVAPPVATTSTMGPSSDPSRTSSTASGPHPRPAAPEKSPSAPPSGIDLGILIALREEFDNFLDLLPAGYRPEPDHEHGGYYYLANAGPQERPYRCVVRFVGDMGPSLAGLATDRLIGRWRPAVVANVGIAASLHGDLKLGDVAVAEQVDSYASNLKAVDDGSGGWEFEHRGRVYHGDHRMLEEVRHLPYAHGEVHRQWGSAASKDLNDVLNSLSKRQRSRLAKAALIRDSAACSAVHLASGPVVTAAAAFNRWLRGKRDGTIKALEMEAAGFAEAAVRRAVPVPTLVVRGISDLGDERKAKLDDIGDGAFRRIAMRNATRFLFALLDAELIPRSAGARGTQTMPSGSLAPTPTTPRIGAGVVGARVSVQLEWSHDPDDTLPARWRTAAEEALREAGLSVSEEGAEHSLVIYIDHDEVGNQRVRFTVDAGAVRELSVMPLPDVAQRVADAVVERVVTALVEKGEPVVVRVVTWPREHVCPHRTIFRLEAPTPGAAQTPSGERWLAAPLERIATALSRVSSGTPILLIAQCTPATAIRAGAVLKRVAGQRVIVIWNEQEWPLDAPRDVEGELAPKLDGRGLDPRDHLCLLVSVSQDVRPAWLRWSEQPNRVPLRELHVQPLSGPSREVLKHPEQAVGWARKIGQWLCENRPPPHAATSIFAATPSPMAVALGRELNAVGKVILMDLDKDQKYVRAFEFDT